VAILFFSCLGAGKVIGVDEDGDLITSRSSSLYDDHPGQAESQPDAEGRVSDQKRQGEKQYRDGHNPGVMHYVIKDQEQQKRRRDRHQAIGGLSQREISQREISQPHISHRAGEKNRYGEQKQQRLCFLGAAELRWLSLIHGAKNITSARSALIWVGRR
jgi:hypothetical protein